MSDVKPGDVIQIEPAHRSLGGCLAIVESVKTWGIVANVPVARDKIAPVRLLPGEYSYVGEATWTTEWATDGDVKLVPRPDEPEGEPT